MNSTIRLLAFISVFVAAHAAAQSCPATQPAQPGGYRIQASSYPNSPYFQTVGQVAEFTRNLIVNFQTQWGLQVCSMELNEADDQAVNWLFTTTGDRGQVCADGEWPGGGFYALDQSYFCPSGYELTQSNTCQLKDATAAVCTAAPNDDRNRGGCPAGADERGNPCYVATGVKHQVELDYAQGQLKFSRYYSSSLTTPQALLGKQWRGEYDRKLLFAQNNQWVSGWPRVYIQRPDGNVLWYAFDGSVATAIYPDTFEKLRKVDFTTWELDLPDGSTEVYKVTPNAAQTDTFGRLEQIRLRGGSVLTLTYSSSNTERLSTVNDGFGHTLTFAYASNKLSTITDPSGRKITYQYNTGGYLSTVLYQDDTPGTLTDNPKRQYNYADSANPGALTSIVDEQGATFAHWTYDTSRRVTLSEHAGGAEAVTLSYGPSGTSVTDSNGLISSYSFSTVQSIPRVSSRIDASISSTYTYTADGFPLTSVDRNGVTTQYGFDTSARPVLESEADGTPRNRSTAIQWSGSTWLPSVVTEARRSTSYSYDTSGNALTKTVTDTTVSPNASRTWTYTYDSFGHVLTANGPRTDVADTTTFNYYTCTTGAACGQLHTVTDALSHTTTFNTYNAHGQPLTITDPNGVVTTLAYDAQLRLTSRTVGSEQTTVTYWPTGLLKKVTLPDGSFLSYVYDSAHRLTEIDDAAGNRVVYTLDAMGNRTAENRYDPSNALARTHSRVFNTLNQLWKEVTASGAVTQQTIFGYDNNGNQTAINAPLSRSSTSSYDELNRRKQITDANSGVTQVAYDADDNVVSVTDPRSLQTTYVYNAFGNLLQRVSPDTGTTTNTFDAAGNLKTAQDARSKTGTYTYDALNRVTQVAYSDQTLTYTYDTGSNGIGRLTSVSDAGHSLSWSYDGLGRVTGKSQVVGSISKTVNYGYTNGRLTAMTLPSGKVITYGYTNGQVTSVKVGTTTILNSVLYDPFGPARQWSWGNGTLDVHTFDTDGKPTQVDAAGLSTYVYDDAFRITTATDTVNSANSWTYGYDALDHLTSATNASAAQGFTYDADGNRLTSTGTVANSFSYSGISNQLSSISGAINRTYSFDASGHTTSDGTVTYTYGDSGRLTSSTVSGVTTNYLVNALGQRSKKSNSSGTTYFVYDEADRLIGEYDAMGATIQEVVWLGSTPVASLRPNGAGVDIFYIHADHLGTPRRITRPSDNAIVWRWDSDPFGTSAANSNPSGLGTFVFNLRFPGQYFDQETGLNYNYFRDYDSLIGRYAESDPLGLVAGVNTYAYVEANPLQMADPRGLAGRGPFQPSTQTALEQAIIRGDLEAIQTLLDAGEISSEAAARALAEAALKNRSIGNVKRLADLYKRSRKAIEDAIHKCKENLPKSAPERNPDVVVDPDTGEVYPLLQNGRLGDSIGNILDALGL